VGGAEEVGRGFSDGCAWVGCAAWRKAIDVLWIYKLSSLFLVPYSAIEVEREDRPMLVTLAKAAKSQ
jgi:hypothetical protein